MTPLVWNGSSRVAHRREASLQDINVPAPISSCLQKDNVAGSEPELMQVDSTRLSPTERSRRMAQGFVYTAGQKAMSSASAQSALRVQW